MFLPQLLAILKGPYLTLILGRHCYGHNLPEIVYLSVDTCQQDGCQGLHSGVTAADLHS